MAAGCYFQTLSRMAGQGLCSAEESKVRTDQTAGTLAIACQWAQL